MALEHVLDTARKLGIPVVITDDRGEAAQVIMPFEDFAAMVGATSPVSSKPRVTRSPKPSARGPVTIPVHEGIDEVVQALNELDIEAIDENLASPTPSTETTVESTKEEGFLEDKFYLEPLNDDESLK